MWTGIITALIGGMFSIIIALINSHKITMDEIKLNWKLTFAWIMFIFCCVYWFVGALTILMWLTVSGFSYVTLGLNLGMMLMSTVVYFFTKKMGQE